MSMTESTWTGYGLRGSVIGGIQMSNVINYLRKTDKEPDIFLHVNKDELDDISEMTVLEYAFQNDDNELSCLVNILNNSDYGDIKFYSGIDSDDEPYIFIDTVFPWDLENKGLTKERVDNAFDWLYSSIDLELSEHPDEVTAHFWG